MAATDPDDLDLTYTWSKVSGPGNVTFGGNGTTDSDVVSALFDSVGNYSLQVTVSNGSASVSAAIDIIADNLITITLNPYVDNITATGAIIHWATDRPTTGNVGYGLTSNYDYNAFDSYSPQLTKNHDISIGGLSSGILYHYSVSANDDFGFVGSEDLTFTTLPGSGSSSPSGDIERPSHLINVAKGVTASFPGLHDVHLHSRTGEDFAIPDSELLSYSGKNRAAGTYLYSGFDDNNKRQQGKVVIIH